LSPQDFDEVLRRWQRTHGQLASLVESNAVRKLKETPIGPERPYYSFARLVVTDSATTAALLLANKFHIDNECAVLSIGGYPFSDWQRIVDLLRGNPDLQIALVHDATPAGCALPARIREDAWFPDQSVRCADVGLRPGQALSMNLPQLNSRGTPGSTSILRNVLKGQEVKWLERGHYTELTALAPKRLMTAITRNFSLLSAAAEPDAEANVWFFSDGDGGGGMEETFG
jgi:hypothetical protein